MSHSEWPIDRSSQSPSNDGSPVFKSQQTLSCLRNLLVGDVNTSGHTIKFEQPDHQMEIQCNTLVKFNPNSLTQAEVDGINTESTDSSQSKSSRNHQDNIITPPGFTLAKNIDSTINLIPTCIDSKFREHQQKAVQATSMYNRQINFQRKEERMCSFDLQTYLFHYPIGLGVENRMLAHNSKRGLCEMKGKYPIAILPDQFHDWYYAFNSEELKHFSMRSTRQASSEEKDDQTQESGRHSSSPDLMCECEKCSQCSSDTHSDHSGASILSSASESESSETDDETFKSGSLQSNSIEIELLSEKENGTTTVKDSNDRTFEELKPVPYELVTAPIPALPIPIHQPAQVTTQPIIQMAALNAISQRVASRAAQQQPIPKKQFQITVQKSAQPQSSGSLVRGKSSTANKPLLAVAGKTKVLMSTQRLAQARKPIAVRTLPHAKTVPVVLGKRNQVVVQPELSSLHLQTQSASKSQRAAPIRLQILRQSDNGLSVSLIPVTSQSTSILSNNASSFSSSLLSHSQSSTSSTSLLAPSSALTTSLLSNSLLSSSSTPSSTLTLTTLSSSSSLLTSAPRLDSSAIPFVECGPTVEIQTTTSTSPTASTAPDTIPETAAEMTIETISTESLSASTEPDSFCYLCKRPSLVNPDQAQSGSDLTEMLIKCTTCANYVHPFCQEMTPDVVLATRQYAWQCIQCKSCSTCNEPSSDTSGPDAKLSVCAKCDRGYHPSCVGLMRPLSSKWVCALCAVCAQCSSRTPDPNGKLSWKIEPIRLITANGVLRRHLLLCVACHLQRKKQ